MKAAEIRALSAEQRAAKLAELKDELFNLHFQQAINQLDNPIQTTHVCTRCNATLLFSHRAAGERRGNCAAFLSLKLK